MIFTIQVNNKKIKAEKGETILSALNRNGIIIPTLCRIKIRTHSPRVNNARKTIVELLLSNHPDDCLYCDRNIDCELQRLAEELNIRERRIRSKKIKPRLMIRKGISDVDSILTIRELARLIKLYGIDVINADQGKQGNIG
jgi:NADH dehydrogenase/NADH:ubiquinone oxidoreductase subunit G